MACCGGRTARVFVETARLVSEDSDYDRGVVVPRPSVAFVYEGHRGLSVEGPLTGRRYRFAAPGAVVEVDGRDAPSLTAVPGLRRLVR